ncbi:MAG: hypothetical protein JSW33_04625, partial [bacterium]
IGLARTKKLGIVISSTFESGITISVLSQLSGMLRPDNLAMGLDTLRWLKKDLLQEDIMIQQGQIDIQKIAAVGQKINWDMLQFIKKIQL